MLAQQLYSKHQANEMENENIETFNKMRTFIFFTTSKPFLLFEYACMQACMCALPKQREYAIEHNLLISHFIAADLSVKCVCPDAHTYLHK